MHHVPCRYPWVERQRGVHAIGRNPMTVQFEDRVQEAEGSFRPHRRVLASGVLLLASLGLPAMLWPQANPTGAPEEVKYGSYRVHQSIEAGYRFSDVTGSESMYNTLINLHEGPRIFEQTLSMQSEGQPGVLFDNLFLNSVGWGGDPNNYLRMRINKNAWYDFRAAFRRDQDYFDY